MDAERQAIHDRLRAFFSGLAPAIEVAQAAQIQIDRRLATSFSVFDDFFHFIHKKENTLSRIFRSLLDPQGRHGQGVKFLEALLEEIDGSIPENLPPRDDLPSCRVHTEYAIKKTSKNGRGSIDIVVEWPSSGYWIGIENKPWADEQNDQVSDYFKALVRKIPAHRAATQSVLVLYFSGSGEEPITIPKEKAEAARCVTLPYRIEPEKPSVEGWLRRCRTACEADRIRWFLMEIEDYIRRSFDHSATSLDSSKGNLDDDQHSS